MEFGICTCDNLKTQSANPMLSANLFQTQRLFDPALPKSFRFGFSSHDFFCKCASIGHSVIRCGENCIRATATPDAQNQNSMKQVSRSTILKARTGSQ